MLTFPEDFPAIYANPIDINFHVWVAVIATLFLTGINYFVQARRITDIPSQRALISGYGFFMLFLGIGRVFVLLAYGPTTPRELFDPLDTFQTLFSQLSVIPAIYALEKYVIPQTKKIFTVLGIVITALGLVPIILNQYSDAFMIGKLVGVIPLFGVVAFLFIFLIKRTTGSIKREAIQIFVGVATMAIGMLLDNNTLIRTQVIPLWVSPLIYLVGVLIFGFSIHMQKPRAQKESQKDIKIAAV